MTSFLAPLDNFNSTKRNNNLFYPTRTECITTQSSFARMSPTSSYGSNMPSTTSVLQHQQHQTSYGMQFLPPPPPFFVQACYPTGGSPNEYPPTYFRPIPSPVNSAATYPTQPPQLMQISSQQHQQTYKPTNTAIPQLMDFNLNNNSSQQMHSPPARRSQYQHQQSKTRPSYNNNNNRYQQSVSPTFSSSSSNKSLEDESEPVLLTRSHSVPDATNDSSYTLATLFRNKIFVGSLTQSVSFFF